MPGLSVLERWGCGECQKDPQIKQIRKTSACAGGYVAMCSMLRGHGLWPWGHMRLFFFCFKTFLFKQLQLRGVTLKLSSEIQGVVWGQQEEKHFLLLLPLRLRANGVSMMQADFCLILNLLPLVLLTFKHTSLTSFVCPTSALSDRPPFHWTVFSQVFWAAVFENFPQ